MKGVRLPFWQLFCFFNKEEDFGQDGEVDDEDDDDDEEDDGMHPFSDFRMSIYLHTTAHDGIIIGSYLKAWVVRDTSQKWKCLSLHQRCNEELPLSLGSN